MQSRTSPSDSGPGLSLTPPAEAAVDQLWKFQLRKENAALLEILAVNEKLIRTSAAENYRKCEEALERITTLEGKLVELAGAERQVEERRESRKREIEALRAQMRVLGENATANARLLAELKGQAMVEDIQTGHSNVITAKDIEASAANNGVLETATSILPSASLVSKTNKSELRSTSCASINNQNIYYNPPTTRSQRKPLNQATQIGGPHALPTKQPQAIPGKQPQAVPTKTTVPANTPFKLRQGNTPFQTYLDNTNNLYHTLPKTDRSFETEFVALFIKGMRDIRHRQRLSEQLLLIHPSRTRKDMSVDVICKWEDVLETLRGMGRVVGGALGGAGWKEKGEVTTVKRGRNILVPKDLMDGE